MKKIISILLVLTIIFSCFALVGCSDIEYFINSGLWKDPQFWLELGYMLITPDPEPVVEEKVVKPNKRNPIVDQLEFDYSDNFDDHDIEFIKSMRYEGYPKVSISPKYDFFYAMSRLSREYYTFYKLNIDTQNILYYIAFYDTLDSLNYLINTGGFSERLKWIKYDNYEDIPSKIDGRELMGTYAVYNCTLEKDILNGTIYNVQGKYYVALIDGDFGIDNVSQYKIYETASWLDLSNNFGNSEVLSIFHTANLYPYYAYSADYYSKPHIPGKDIYPYYIDENGLEYLFSSKNLTIQSLVDQYWAK